MALPSTRTNGVISMPQRGRRNLLKNRLLQKHIIGTGKTKLPARPFGEVLKGEISNSIT